MSTNLIQTTIDELNQISNRLLRDFSKVPDDRLNWAPSATARTPLAIFAHCGFSLGFIGRTLEGTPYPAPTMEQADAEFLEMEKTVLTRERALQLWEDSLAKYVAILQELREEDLASTVTLPFSLGAAPMHYMIGMGAVHTREHVAQLEYIQTIYGDREW